MKHLIIGAGGHAKVLAEALLLSGKAILGFVDAQSQLKGGKVLDFSVLGGDDDVLNYSPEEVLLVNGVGSVGDNKPRQKLFDLFKSRGYRFATVIHPSAIVSPRVTFGEGVQVMAGSIIQIGTQIGQNTIINSGAIVDHDCVIGEHVHVAPGCTISGGVRVGRLAHIGSGSTLIQGLRIGEESLIGAGSVVVKEVAPSTKVFGVAAHRNVEL